MDSYCVYMHITPNDKKYVGITRQKPEKRWRKGCGYKENPYFFNAIQKYGWENIKHEILIDGLRFEEAEYYEKYYIALYQSNNPLKGYNCESGGTSGKQLAESTKKKLSEINKLKGHDGNYFKQWREKGGQPWNKGKKGYKIHTEQHKKELSQRMKGENNPAYGKDYSKNRKIYDTNPKGKDHHASKPIEQYDLNGNFIKEFENIARAAEYLGKEKSSDVSNVVACAKGKRPTAYGYIWKYKIS